jgi:UDP-N-acetyl-D-glucosamine dehydrogenase
MNNRVGVIGLGYVGLPLVYSLLELGDSVVGFDQDLSKLKAIKSLDIKDFVPNINLFKAAFEKNTLIVTDEFKLLNECTVVVVCVPTPLDSNKKPDLSHVISSAKNIGERISANTLVILESTVSPGTTRNIFFSEILAHTVLNKKDIHVSYSPERIDPANQSWNLKNTPKLIGGMDDIATQKAIDFYSRFVEEVVTCDTVEIAETSKLVENSFRLINISFINEMSIFCQKMNIDVNKVIKAASTKPYGFMAFHPSIGAGGHCIPVDPLYLSDQARTVGVNISLVDLADKINRDMPIHFADRAEQILGTLLGKKIVILGVSYKPNVPDVRETPAAVLIWKLSERGATVMWHDEIVKEWRGESSVALNESFDLAIIATNHDYLDLRKLGKVPILNTNGSIL